ncbi:MAG TPA: hypothetical protein VEZ41_01415 [Allosphingosinicella sp.]|nr:hypothetical protein [Allosphingosinicella sp.]
MTADSVVIIVEAEGDPDPELKVALAGATGSEVRVVQKHGLTGEVASWLLIGNFVVTTLATLTPIFLNHLKDRRVKSIKVGDLVVENPKPDDIAAILRTWSGDDHEPA